MRVSAEEVKQLLQRVGNGELSPTLVDPSRSWKSVFCGDIEYKVGDWKVVVFNDCDDWDYVDSVVAPDGRFGEFEDWFGPEDSEGHRPWMQPDSMLDREDSDCYLRMVQAFERATG